MPQMFVLFIAIFIFALLLQMLVNSVHIWLPFVITIAAIPILIWFLIYVRKKHAEVDEEKRQAVEAKKRADDQVDQERRAQENRKNQEISYALDQVNRSLRQATTLVVAIPGHLRSSEKSLSIAIDQIKRRSFYPFWDSIGDSVEHLNTYKESILSVERLRNEFSRNLNDYKKKTEGRDMQPVGTFPLTQIALPILRRGCETADRIDALYEIAHSDYEFSNIYANWRTNKTLVAGFENLSAGLHGLRDEIATTNFMLKDGFDSINTSISDSTEAIVSNVSNVSDAINSNSRRVEQEMANKTIDVNSKPSPNGNVMGDKYPEVRNAGNRQQDEMIRLLNNIQHGRKDIPFFEFGHLPGTRPK